MIKRISQWLLLLQINLVRCVDAHCVYIVLPRTSSALLTRVVLDS